MRGNGGNERAYVFRSLAKIMRERNVPMEEKRELWNSIFLPTMTYGS